MHDCTQMDGVFAELLFQDGGPVSLQGTRLEGCESCAARIQQLQGMLDAFDGAIDMSVPSDNTFWDQYESRLRARLEGQQQQKRRESLISWLTPPMWVYPAAAAFLVLIVVGYWGFRERSALVPDDNAVQRRLTLGSNPPGAAPAPDLSGSQIIEQTEAEGKQQRTIRRVDTRPGIGQFSPFHPNPATYDPGAASAVSSLDMARHLERAQYLLRSFRNSAIDDEALKSFPDERERSRVLLNQSRLLRRSAEATGDIAMTEILDGLEPVLLDIANLPEHPRSDDVRAIQDRINKTEIVGTLSVYGNSLASRGTVME